MSCRCDNDDDLIVDSNGCFRCIEVPKVKGRFGLAWVSESPECPRPEPVGWQVEFLDTPSKVEQKCQEMVRWINCPPLPRCDPCPPDELCCPSNPPRCNPCAPKCNPCLPKCGMKCTCKSPQQAPQAARASSTNKKCCCCCAAPQQQRTKRSCFPPAGTPYCRTRSPRRRNTNQCTCETQEAANKCTCDDIPVKDTNNGICSSSGSYYKCNSLQPTQYCNQSYLPPQVPTADEPKCTCSKPTLTLYRNENHKYNTDTDYTEHSRNNNENKQNNADKNNAIPNNTPEQSVEQPNEIQSERQNPEEEEEYDCECCECETEQTSKTSAEQPITRDSDEQQQQQPEPSIHTEEQEPSAEMEEHEEEEEEEEERWEHVEVQQQSADKSEAAPESEQEVEEAEITAKEVQREFKTPSAKSMKSMDSMEKALYEMEQERIAEEEAKKKEANTSQAETDEHEELEKIFAEAERVSKPTPTTRHHRTNWFSPLLCRLCFKSKDSGPDESLEKPAEKKKTEALMAPPSEKESQLTKQSANTVEATPFEPIQEVTDIDEEQMEAIEA